MLSTHALKAVTALVGGIVGSVVQAAQVEQGVTVTTALIVSVLCGVASWAAAYGFFRAQALTKIESLGQRLQDTRDGLSEGMHAISRQMDRLEERQVEHSRTTSQILGEVAQLRGAHDVNIRLRPGREPK